MKEWIYGRNTVKEIIGRREVYEVVILNGTNNGDIISLCRKNNINFRMSEKKEFQKIAGNARHQGVAAQIEGYDYTPLGDILMGIPEGKMPLLVMLDGLEDPHNLGAILRTCDAIGADGVIIGKHRSVSLSATVAKVSTGAINYVPVAQVTNLSRTIKDLQAKGYWAVACENEDAKDYRAQDYNMPLVVVIGSEGKGISRLVKQSCDFNVVLPMTGHVTSLNASVATGIILYEIYNSRHPL